MVCTPCIGERERDRERGTASMRYRAFWVHLACSSAWPKGSNVRRGLGDSNTPWGLRHIRRPTGVGSDTHTGYPVCPSHLGGRVC
jgi:hypothetical protein